MMTAFARTIILYFLIMIGLRLMGKRQIGELEPSELVLTMMISDLATVPMQDFGIPLLAGVIPILTLLSLSMLMSQLSLWNLRFRELVCGTPAVLIRHGVIQQQTMRENRYTLDELLEELRSQGVSCVEDVKYAILENSGQLSVLPWSRQQPPTAAQLHLEVEDDVTAYLEFANGATGVFVTTTGDAPGTNRFEVSGTLGKLVCEDCLGRYARGYFAHRLRRVGEGDGAGRISF